MEKLKLIFDMDSDADNLLALAYALRSPELEVLGVVTGHGFCQPETAAAGVNTLLSEMGVELPVIPGAQRPLMRDNMEKAIERPAPGTVMDTAAWDWMYKALAESEEKVTVCLLGTATNLMHLLHKYPDAAEKIEKILFVGGAFSFGTVTAAACHKVYFDAEGMQFLMHSGVPFYVATVDVTSGYAGGEEVSALMERFGGVWSAVAAKAAPAVPATRFVRAPLAMVSLTHPELFSYGHYKCNVELHGELTYGMTVIYRNDFDGVIELESGEKVRVEVAEKDKNVWDMNEFDRQQVMAIVTERLGAAKNGGAA